MNQEIKLKLEQAAETATEQIYPRGKSVHRNTAHYQGFEAGAQNILENPGEWGLVPKAEHGNAIVKYIMLQSEYSRYQYALEKIADRFDPETQDFEGIIRIAEEALKQE